MTGNSAHIVDVPFWDYMVRILQTVVTGGQLILTAYTVAFGAFDAIILALFTSAWGLAILGYYLISVHALPYIYNWVAIIIVEFLTVAFWASSFSACAALYADPSRRELLYGNVTIAIIAISAFLFALHLLTFGMVAHGVMKHRRNGHPLFSPQGRAAQDRVAKNTSV